MTSSSIEPFGGTTLALVPTSSLPQFSDWNVVTNVPTFDTAATSGPLGQVPALLPTSGLTDGSTTPLTYYIRFITAAGGALTFGRAQYFALNDFTFNDSQTLVIGSQSPGTGAGKISFNDLSVSFSQSALFPILFGDMAGNTALGEIDILGYNPNDNHIVDAYNFGLAGGDFLTLDASGNVQMSFAYDAQEVQHSTKNPDGTYAIPVTSAWNRFTSTSGFSRNGSTSATPIAAATTLSPTSTLVAPAVTTTPDYYLRFLKADGTVLTLDGNSLFAVGDFSAGATQILNFGAPSLGGSHLTFDTFTASLSQQVLTPGLFHMLAAGVAFSQVDVLGYAPAGATNAGTLMTAQDFGNVLVSGLTIDSSGIARLGFGYTSMETQALDTAANRTLTSSWNVLTGTTGFATGHTPAGLTAVPTTLPTTGIAANTVVADHYYIRFIDSTGAVLTSGTAQYFALTDFTYNDTNDLLLTSTSFSSRRILFNDVSVTLSQQGLSPTLFSALAAGTAFNEIDIVGYNQTNNHVTDITNLGLVGLSQLGTDSTGALRLSLGYGSKEIQHSSQNADGSYATAITDSWNRVTNLPNFSTNGTATTTPIAVATTLSPTDTTVSPPVATSLDYYARFIKSDGSTLTLNGSTMFALHAFADHDTQSLSIGLQSTGIGAGKVTFDPTTLELSQQELEPLLLRQIALSPGYSQVDVLGYAPAGATNAGKLVTAIDYGNVAGAALTAGSTGMTTLAIAYGSKEIQVYNGIQSTPVTASWNRISNASGFATGHTPPGLTAVPTNLPSVGVAPDQTAPQTYYLRLIQNNATLTLNNAQYFALDSFSVTDSADITQTITGNSLTLVSANLALGDLTVGFSQGILAPSLFGALAGGKPFDEVDVLGYDPTTHHILTAYNFGLVGADSLTLTDTGSLQASFKYAAQEIQTAHANPNGSYNALVPALFDQASQTTIFTTNGTTTATPAAIASVLSPTDITVAPAVSTTSAIYARFTQQDGTELTVNGNSLFRLQSFSSGDTQTYSITATTTPFVAVKVNFAPVHLTFADPALTPLLIATMPLGTPFNQVDILTYDLSNSAATPLITALDLGFAAIDSFTTDTSGLTSMSLEYGSQAVQSANVSSLACFREGTVIRTPGGEAAVETLREGDLITTASGLARPVRWIGTRMLDFARHPGAQQARPICVQSHAFGFGLPQRDLWLSPEHAVFVDDVLIPIRHLVNGTTIARDGSLTSIRYFHVELETHDVLLAEGLPAESWLDTGNRQMFANAPVTALTFDESRGATQAWAGRACAELVESGPVLDAVRHQVGVNTVHDVAFDRAGEHHVTIPAGTTTIRLLSATGFCAGDRRRLGIAIRHLALDEEMLDWTDRRLQGGFHTAEACWCWTDGAALIAPDLLPYPVTMIVDVVALALPLTHRCAK
jgi:hypothetical protein